MVQPRKDKSKSKSKDKDKPVQTPELPGIKHDGEKPRHDLISPMAMAFLAQVLTFGAQKYDANNWRKGIDQSRLLSAAQHHIDAFRAGIDNDPETGLPHIAHAMCCCMFSLEQLTSPHNLDSRFVYTESQKDLLENLLAKQAFRTPDAPDA